MDRYFFDYEASEQTTIDNFTRGIDKRWLAGKIKVTLDRPKREPNTWLELAIPFRLDLSDEQLIRQIVKLRACEYYGTKVVDGLTYHLFWWD